MVSSFLLMSLVTLLAADTGQQKQATERATLSDMTRFLADWEDNRQRLQQGIPKKLLKQVDHHLGLAAGCRWEEAARQIRATIEEYSEQCRAQEDFFVSTLFSLEFAAATSRDDLEQIFSTSHARFDPKKGLLTLRYPDGVPKAWEVQGNRKNRGGTVLLPGKGVFSLNVPFRGAGISRSRSVRGRNLQPCVFQTRLCELEPESSLTLIWRTAMSGKEVRTHYTVERLPSGSARTLIEVNVDGKAKSRQRPVAIGKGIFSNWVTLSSKVESQQVTFSVGGGFKRTVSMPVGETLRFELRGNGRGAVLDWVEVSGSVDGLWLSRQLVLRGKDRAAKYWRIWENPLEEGKDM